MVDSSVFVSFFNDKDIFNKKTTKLFEHFSQEKSVELILPIIVFLEITHVLQKILINFDGQQIFKIFSSSKMLDLTYSQANDLLPIMASLSLKTNDAAITAIAKVTSSTLITWDNKLQKEAIKLVKTYTPQEFMKIAEKSTRKF